MNELLQKVRQLIWSERTYHKLQQQVDWNDYLSRLDPVERHVLILLLAELEERVQQLGINLAVVAVGSTVARPGQRGRDVDVLLLPELARDIDSGSEMLEGFITDCLAKDTKLPIVTVKEIRHTHTLHGYRDCRGCVVTMSSGVDLELMIYEGFNRRDLLQLLDLEAMPCFQQKPFAYTILRSSE